MKYLGTIILSYCLCAILLQCGPSNPLANSYSFEDKTVFELIDKLNKNPNDKQAAEMLPQAYQAALDKRKETIIAEKTSGSLGDRWMEIAKEREITKQMYDAIKASPAASKVIPDPRDPTQGIMNARQKAAEEYYNQGVQYLNYNNRQYARQAYDMFSKADNAVPGYKDTRNLILIASDMATIKVVVNPVNYYNYGFNHWGFSNDWLQQQMVSDLNMGSFRDTRFYTDWDARARNIQIDRVVDLHFVDLYVGTLYSDSYTIPRSKQIIKGYTKSQPAQPIYETINAAVYVTRRVMQSHASLECRIWERPSGRNILYDRFPDTYNWKLETATYRGDQRALTNQDWALINNRWDNNPPSRNQIADRLIRNCYGLLINRIRSSASF